MDQYGKEKTLNKSPGIALSPLAYTVHNLVELGPA